jgi:hypothetical protein
MPRRKKQRQFRVTVSFSPDEKASEEAFARAVRIVLESGEKSKNQKATSQQFL